MFLKNENSLVKPYPQELRDYMSLEVAKQSREWLANWTYLAPKATPLWHLIGFSESLGLNGVWVKDESLRSPLGSFKALGAPIALTRLIIGLLNDPDIDAKKLIAGDYKDKARRFTVISATDGNHGRALAAAAQTVGCRCVIILHANVSIEREEAIAHYGAEIVRIQGGYDESVSHAAALAEKNGWYVVSDTSYDGYEVVPRDVMQGYATIAAESIEQRSYQHGGECPFTHVIIQGGVGGLAAGVVSYFWEVFNNHRPAFIVVEPRQADCLFQSAKYGRASAASGSVDSVMAGLACGETSPLAWLFLKNSIDAFMTITDEQAEEAMRKVAIGVSGDIPVEMGESGVAGVAALDSLMSNLDWASQVGLNATSRVLLINTEGATAPSIFQEIVGEPASTIRARQQAWLINNGCAGVMK